MGAILDAEFPEDVRHVVLHGALGNVQLRADLLVAAAGGEQLQHAEFALGKRVGERLGNLLALAGGEAVELGHHAGGHGRFEDGTFVGDDIEVKHSNEYEAANQDRLDQASNACQEQEQQG